MYRMHIERNTKTGQNVALPLFREGKEPRTGISNHDSTNRRAFLGALLITSGG